LAIGSEKAGYDFIRTRAATVVDAAATVVRMPKKFTSGCNRLMVQDYYAYSQT